MTVPTFDFTVAGEPMRSGTELRKLYAESDEAGRQAIIQDLFGRYTREAEQIMNSKIPAEPATKLEPAPEPVTEQREPYQQAIDRLSQQQIEQLNSLIDEITHRITTEKLPPQYVQALKQRLDKLKAERVNIALGRS
jgi:hypothetical protein